jgi:small subunit ribosomal protein S4
MARYTGPRNRLARREGIDLGLKTVGSKSHATLLRKLNVPPGQHGAKGKRKVTGYGIQLREKQKVKRLYGLLEKQFRTMFSRAKKFKGNTGDKFLSFLERRLDNVVYRMGLAPTRPGARQLVTHGHVMVNGAKLSIPSYQVKKDDVITIKPKSLEMPIVKQMLEDKSFKPADWLERKGPVGKVLRDPVRADIQEDINEQLIVEFYSR